MKQATKIKVLGVKKGENRAVYLDENLNLQTVSWEKGKEPEFEVVKHPTLEVVSVEPLELKHRTS